MVFFDRVKETSTTAGTGAITLAGAETGFRSFSSVLTTGNTVYYCIQGQTPGEWETGIGTYSGVNTLTRTTPTAGSAATPVSFSAGIKDVFITVGAAYFGIANRSADVALYALLPGETVYKAFTTAAGTSIPLYITTVEGIYEIRIYGDRSVSLSNNNNMTLSPNDTTYSGAIRKLEMEVTSGAETSTNSTNDFFKITDGLLLAAKIEVSTFTKMKTFSSYALELSTGPAMYKEELIQAWEDTTTAWTSLGTITLPYAQNINMLIKRLV